MIGYERDTIRIMREGQNKCAALASFETRREIEKDHPHLNQSQRAAIEQILESRDQVTALEGVAGSGKTTSLAVVREAAEGDGYKVEGFAPTLRATQKLAEAGIESSTLQRHLAQSNDQHDGQKHLYVLDESSLASTKQMNEFLHRLKDSDRILLVGDTRQHQAVEAGTPYQQLEEAGIQTARLDEIIRQKDPALKEVVEHLSRGEVKEAIEKLEKQSRVHETADPNERLEAIPMNMQSCHKERSLSPPNQSRMEINRMIHAEMQKTGQVDQRERNMRVLVARQEIIEAGEYAALECVNAKENLLTVKRDTGKQASYDPRRLQGVALYRETERAFAQGDGVQFTAPNREQHVANRELGTIEKIEANGNLQLRMDSGRRVTFNVKENPHLNYGYAVTSRSSQGHENLAALQSARDFITH